VPQCFLLGEVQTNQASIKLHTLYDIKTDIPAFINITEANVHDINAMNAIPYETDSYTTHHNKSGILSDQKIKLTGLVSGKKYPKKLGRVVYYAEALNRTFLYLTNSSSL